MLSMIDSAVAGAAPFLPVRLIVFPEFAHSAPVFETAQELSDKLAIEIPNEHTERLEKKARARSMFRAVRCWKLTRNGRDMYSMRLA
jgi:predicted amidohydrolase